MSFHSLNFDKTFVKYCKKLKENCTCLLKIKTKKNKKQANSKKNKEMTASDFLESFFFQLIQRKYLQIDWKVYNLSQLSKPKQRVNFKTWLLVKKNFIIGRTHFCCKSVCYKRKLSLVTKGSRGQGSYRSLKKYKNIVILFPQN